MIDVLTSPFMLRAFLAGSITALAAPAIGTYLVQRRQSLLGDGIGHICVTGVALGLLTGTSPTLAAVAVAIIGALLIELIRRTGKASADVALALLFYGGIAGGLVLISLAGNGAIALQSYLFGSITTISTLDLVVTVTLAALVLIFAVLLSPQLFAVSNDEDFARAAGLRVDAYSLLVSVLAAVTVSVAMRTVGLLLVSALMVIPVATAQQFARGFQMTMYTAMGLGALAAVLGLGTAAAADVPPGATIVLVALLGFALAAPVGAVLQRRRRAAVPFPAVSEPVAYGSTEHRHQHGPRCGHLAIEHGDHVDYVHHGHRHAAHEDHYDEH